MADKKRKRASPAKGSGDIRSFMAKRAKDHEDDEEKVEKKKEKIIEKKKEKENDSGEEEEEEEEESESEEKEKEKRAVKRPRIQRNTTGKGKDKIADDDNENDEENEENSEPAEISSNSGLASYLENGKWKELLSSEFNKPYFKQIESFLKAEEKAHGAQNIFPPKEDIFSALNSTPFEKVRVVILGQDPYFRTGQAHGLAFSVRKGVKVPPSLNRIYNELLDDPEIKGFKKPKHGYLQEWAERGVLMINATMTVREGKPNSHEKCGWQTFTDAVIKCLNTQAEGIVFLLWGGFAQKKGKIINTSKHHVLQCAHPSPMSGAAWLGNRHFSQANALLVKQGAEPIDWSLSP